MLQELYRLSLRWEKSMNAESLQAGKSETARAWSRKFLFYSQDKYKMMESNLINIGLINKLKFWDYYNNHISWLKRIWVHGWRSCIISQAPVLPSLYPCYSYSFAMVLLYGDKDKTSNQLLHMRGQNILPLLN